MPCARSQEVFTGVHSELECAYRCLRESSMDCRAGTEAALHFQAEAERYIVKIKKAFAQTTNNSPYPT